MRRLLALLVPVLLLATACSPGSTDTAAPAPSASVSIPPSNAQALASVKVEDLGKGKAPKVTFDKPLAIKAESMRLVTPGDGAQIKSGQIVAFQQVMLNATDGATIGESFTKEQSNKITLDENFKSQFALVYSTFAEAKVGAFIAYATPAVPAVAGSTEAPAQPEQPAAMSVFKVISATDAPAPAKLMSADDVAALAKDGKLPVAKFDAKGIPSITIPKNDPPADLAVQVLTEGKGDVLAASDSISALYTGWTWSDGKSFDSAYDRGEAATFSLQGVIPGWTQGLTGQKVGSTVLLTIPTSLAYGEEAAAQGKPAGTLVFVVKIESKK
ncbi:FKBP-type peptidyl-prolyl cis-trans isomerase [Arthrobacter sp. HLT1-20]